MIRPIRLRSKIALRRGVLVTLIRSKQKMNAEAYARAWKMCVRFNRRFCITAIGAKASEAALARKIHRRNSRRLADACECGRR